MHAKIKSLSITTIVVRVPNKSSSDKKKGVYREDSYFHPLEPAECIGCRSVNKSRHEGQDEC